MTVNGLNFLADITVTQIASYSIFSTMAVDLMSHLIQKLFTTVKSHYPLLIFFHFLQTSVFHKIFVISILSLIRSLSIWTVKTV